jgi:hypothetical protein
MQEPALHPDYLFGDMRRWVFGRLGTQSNSIHLAG